MKLPSMDKVNAFFNTLLGKALIFILGVGFSKGCDLAVDRWNAPERDFSITAETCFQGELLDGDSNRRSWNCVATFRNYTGSSNSLQIGCKVTSGNFVGPVAIVNRGGGEAKLQEKICFDESQNAERVCSQTLQKDEFVILKFEVAAYEKPNLTCYSDSL